MEQAVRLSQRIISEVLGAFTIWFQYSVLPGQQECKMDVVWVSQLLREYMRELLSMEALCLNLYYTLQCKHVKHARFGKNMA